MNKLLYVLPLTLLLSGCYDSMENVRIKQDPLGNVKSISELCLDNVSYYFYTSGSKGSLSPRISPVTLQPVNCK